MNLTTLDIHRYEDIKFCLQSGMNPSHRDLITRWGLARNKAGGSSASVFYLIGRLKSHGLIDCIKGKEKSMITGRYKRCGLNVEYLIGAFAALRDPDIQIESYIQRDYICVAYEMAIDNWGSVKAFRQDTYPLDAEFIKDEYKRYSKSKQSRKCMKTECCALAFGQERMCEHHRKKAQEAA